MKNIIIQTMAKDEDHIVNEFIVHNVLLGIEHIYIYDDGSSLSISEKIKELPVWIQNKVTVYRLDENKNFYEREVFEKSDYYDVDIYNKYKKRKQLYFMNYFLKHHKNISKWCFFTDVDEFIYLKDSYTIDNFLSEYDEYDSIFIPWIYFGSSYHITQPDGLVIDRFRYHCDHYAISGKSICKLSITNIDCVHKISKNINKYIFNSSEKLYNLPIHINHYIVNSVKMYITRKLRNNIGQENGGVRASNGYYNILCSLNQIHDNIMDKYVYEVNKILKKDVSNNNNITANNAGNLLKLNGEIVYSCDTHEKLLEILNSDDVEYCNV